MHDVGPFSHRRDPGVCYNPLDDQAPRSLGTWFDRFERCIARERRPDTGLARLRHDGAVPRLWRREFLEFLEERALPRRFIEPPAAPEPPFRCIESDKLATESSRAPGVWYGVLETRVEGRATWLWSLLLVGTNGENHEVLVLAERGEDATALLADYQRFWYRNSIARARNLIYVRGNGDDSEMPRELGLGWDDLVLPAELREDVHAQVAGFMAGPERFRRLGIPHRRGFLLVGPPGNGKSTFCRVLASVTPLPFLLFKPVRGTDDNDLKRAFQEAGQLAPAIVCFEDIDSLFLQSEVSLSGFLNLLDGMDRMDGLLIVATTNHPEAVDPALKDRPVRFDRVWHFGNPGPAERETVLRKLAAGRWSEPRIDLARDLSEGLSMAHIREIYVTASLRAMDQGRDEILSDDVAWAIGVVTGHHEAASRDFEERAPVGFGFANPRAVYNRDDREEPRDARGKIVSE